MYSDLFDQLGRGGRSGTAAEPVEEPPLVSLKAGKMVLTPTSNTENSSSFHCTADPARGEIRLVWKDGSLHWQWYDRRNKTVQETHQIEGADKKGSTVTRVPLADKLHENDRVFVWSTASEHKMYWMQSADAGDEEALIQTINEYLQDPSKAAPEGASSNAATAGGTLANLNDGASSTGGGANANQVDALSSILENLGMPQNGDTSAAGGANNTNQLTLADLQGAMAGIGSNAAAAAQAAPGPPLNDVLTAAAIDSLLESEDVVQRLLPLMPPDQQTVALLRDNLLSPQMRNTVSALQQALLPDDTGDLSGYASVIANFQLDAADGETALTQGNPVAAFLECVIAAVEKGEEEEEEEDNNNDDAIMEEEKNDGGETKQDDES